MVSFAMAMASSRVVNVCTASTGPKISSRTIDMSGRTPEKIVGSKNRPPLPMRLPPTTISAPDARPAST